MSDINAKYTQNLVKIVTFFPLPQYKRLRMFLRCLNCEWDVPEVMDTVMNSSYWNKIVVLIAQEDKKSRELALKMLDDMVFEIKIK